MRSYRNATQLQPSPYEVRLIVVEDSAVDSKPFDGGDSGESDASERAYGHRRVPGRFYPHS